MKQNNLRLQLQKGSMKRGSLLEKKPWSVTTEKSKPGFHKTNLCSRSSTLARGRTELKVGAKAGSTRLAGDLQEAQVQHIFETLGFDIKETANSGAKNFDGDILIFCNKPDFIRAEVKFRNTSGFTISKNHWKEIKHKSLLNGGTPALITINNEKEQLITMNTKDLALLLIKNIEQCKTPLQN